MLALLFSEKMIQNDEIDCTLCSKFPDYSIDYALPAKLIQGISIPKTYKKAMNSKQSDKWQEAITSEINQLV